MDPLRSPGSPPGAQGVVRFYDYVSGGGSFLADVLQGLGQPQKSIPPKYFYDEAGCRLFEAICELPEYYPTRTELAIMRTNIGDIAKFAGPDAELIELGSGAGVKTRLLIEALRPPLYVPIDIAGETMRAASTELAQLFPWLNVAGISADYTKPIKLPNFVGLPIRRKVVFFPGSTIGNFTREEALEFMRLARGLAGPGGALIIGVDLKKDRRTLEAAYDDAQGVTARFNLNVLARVNRELGGDFRLERFRHKAFYDPVLGRIEMHLESLYSQVAHVGGQRFKFRPGETIHTEISCKYAVEEFRQLGRAAGFNPEALWVDDQHLFSVHGMTVG